VTVAASPNDISLTKTLLRKPLYENMETNLYIAFVGVSVAVIVIPGPSVLLIVSNSLQQGTAAGLYTVTGVSIAMLMQLGIAMAGLTSLVMTVERGLIVLRWAGIIYLFYLGVQRWRCQVPMERFTSDRGRRPGPTFTEGFVVALTNPTTLLFFIAFFPQFIEDASAPGQPLWLMSVTFWVLALLFDVGYAGLAARVGKALREHRGVRLRNRLSGAIMVGAAAALSLTNV
jgi:homoserine/homoserine lactone efflux protein